MSCVKCNAFELGREFDCLRNDHPRKQEARRHWAFKACKQCEMRGSCYAWVSMEGGMKSFLRREARQHQLTMQFRAGQTDRKLAVM